MLLWTLLLACGPDRSAQLLARDAPTESPDRPLPATEAPSTSATERPRPDHEPTPVDTGLSDTGLASTDPSTTAACWWEPITPDADLSDLQPVAPHTARATAYEAMRRRWPAGHDLLVDMSHDPYIDVFLDGSSWGAFSDSLLIVAHEETHGWDYEHALYPQRFDFFFTGSYAPGGPWYDDLPRSVIRPLVDDDATALYADLYLTGTQGTYGFTELLDETACYVNDLGAAVAFADGLPWQLSARDGAVTFLYYLAVYLDYAAQHEPALYARWQSDPGIHATVRDLWLRTHFFLDYADADPGLGVYDHQIKPLLYAEQPVLEAFLGYGLDASPCLP